MQEKIVENKQCKKCNSEFRITDKDLEFYKKISPKFWDQIYEIPSPSLCPDCEEHRRLAFINRRKLYKRKCDATGKDIISIYSPDKDIVVYDKDYWWSDAWDALDYGMDFDFGKSAFSQFYELTRKVPYSNLSGSNNENCDFNNSIYYSKNCYMSFWGHNLENAYYVDESEKIFNSSDLWWSGNINQSYECFNCANMYNSKYCNNCNNWNNLILCKECDTCQDCFMCIWLKNKKYCILNKEYSKEDYKEKLKDIDLWNYNKLNLYKKKFKEFELKLPHKPLEMENVENCLWDYIYNSKDCINSFNLVDVQNAKNLYEWWRVSNVRNSSVVYDSEGFILSSISVFDKCFNIIFSEYIYDNSKNIIYSSNLKSCSNCFLCVWLKNKKYCILNKQYLREDYEKLVSRIIKYMKEIKEWGNFFPNYISKFWYNETVAMDEYPMIKEDIIDKEFNYSDYKAPFPKVEKIIPAEKLPENIKDIPDDILNRAIECKKTKKLFRIMPWELEFYRKHSLPIPRLHPDERYLNRIKIRNPRKFFERNCNNCKKKIKTTYSPDRSEIVYCEECYKKEIY